MGSMGRIGDYSRAKLDEIIEDTSGSGSVAGSDTQVQFNDEGTMGAASNLSYADSTGYLGVGTTGNNITHALTLPDTAGAAGRVKANAYLTYSSIQYKDNINTIKEPSEDYFRDQRSNLQLEERSSQRFWFYCRRDRKTPTKYC